MAGIHDDVLAWGEANGYSSYDDAKRALIADRDNSEIIAAAGGDMSWNEALIMLATVPPYEVGDALLLEMGDYLLLESGDRLLIDF